MTKVAVFGDLHMGVKTGTREDIAEALLKKLEFAGDWCEESGVEKALFAGDFFENVNHYLPTSIMLRFADQIKRFKYAGYITGNHDWHVSMGLKWEDEPIGMLHNLTGNMVNLNNETYKLDGFTILGRAWEKKYDLGRSEGLECPENHDPEKTIMLTHSYLLPAKHNIMDQYVSYENLKNPCKMYLVGHYHDSLGHMKYGNNHLLIMGSLIRNKVSETHTPYFYCLTLEDGKNIKVETIEVPHETMDEVFIDNSADRQLIKLKDGISEFVSSLSTTQEVLTKEVFIEMLAETAKKEIPEHAESVITFTQDVLDEKLK